MLLLLLMEMELLFVYVVLRQESNILSESNGPGVALHLCHWVRLLRD